MGGANEDKVERYANERDVLLSLEVRSTVNTLIFNSTVNLCETHENTDDLDGKIVIPKPD